MQFAFGRYNSSPYRTEMLYLPNLTLCSRYRTGVKREKSKKGSKRGRPGRLVEYAQTGRYLKLQTCLLGKKGDCGVKLPATAVGGQQLAVVVTVVGDREPRGIAIVKVQSLL